MNRRFTTLLVACAVVVCAGCADTHEKVVQDSIDTMGQLAGILQSIETVDDAKNAREELDRIAKRMKALQSRKDALGTLEKEEEERLKKKYERQMAEVLGRYLSARFKLATKPDVAQEIDGSLASLKKNPLKTAALRSGR